MLKALTYIALSKLSTPLQAADPDSCTAFVDEYVYQTAPALPTLTAQSSPLESKYSALLNQTCGRVLAQLPVLTASDAAAFMASYANYTGYNNETNVIRSADVLLARADLKAFLSRQDSFQAGGADGDLVLCAVLVDATPVGLANFSGQGKVQEATVNTLLADTTLMRDMLVAGGATNGHKGEGAGSPARYGEAATIFAAIAKASAVLSLRAIAGGADTAASTLWDDRSQGKSAVLYRAALAVALEHAVPVNFRFTQTASPPWGPGSTGPPSAAVVVDPVARYMYYESAYLAGNLDPAFEVTTAFEMRHSLNGDATDGDLAWVIETMGIYGPENIAMDYSVGSAWRYAETVHKDVAYVHTHCPQPNYTAVCSGHYSEIPAKGGICGFRAFWGRIARKSFGIPTWGATHSGHAAMTSWNPQGWVIMLAGQQWSQGAWGQQGGDDFHLDVQSRELRPAYQQFLRGSWAARARGDAPAGQAWECNYASKGKCLGFGIGGLWSALMLYQKKAAVAAAVFPNGTSSIPARPIGPSTIPTKVDALIKKWPSTSHASITTAADGTITIPAAAYAPAPLTTSPVQMMQSYADDGTQVKDFGGSFYQPNTSALVYQVEAATAGSFYLSANFSTWHTDQDLMAAVNGKSVGNLPVFLTLGYWNETQPIAVDLVKGMNTLAFTRLSSAPLTFREFFLSTKKKVVPAPPGGGFTPQPITPPLPSSSFIVKPPTTSCILQGLVNVPENLCEDACILAANRTYTGPRPETNVKGCFAITTGPYQGNCNFNSNTSAVCAPPCGADGNDAEICMVKSLSDV